MRLPEAETVECDPHSAPVPDFSARSVSCLLADLGTLSLDPVRGVGESRRREAMIATHYPQGRGRQPALASPRSGCSLDRVTVSSAGRLLTALPTSVRLCATIAFSRTIENGMERDIIDVAYRLLQRGPNAEVVVAVTGVVSPEAINAVGMIGEHRHDVGLLAVTSSDRLNVLAAGRHRCGRASADCLPPAVMSNAQWRWFLLTARLSWWPTPIPCCSGRFWGTGRWR